jgi:hypothetical protein
MEMKIIKDQAIQIAREECVRRGLPLLEPVSVNWGLFRYRVWFGQIGGGHDAITIRRRDGKVLHVDSVPY